MFTETALHLLCRLVRLGRILMLLLLLAGASGLAVAASPSPGLGSVVRESTVYTTADADNGAGPLWDYHASNVARVGDTVWVSGRNTVLGLPPLNNTECNLWTRTAAGWRLVHTLPGLTREPCPIGVLPGGRIVISTNVTRNVRGKAGGGPAQPGLWEYDTTHADAKPELSVPQWRKGASLDQFTEHSYRSLAIDRSRGEIFLLQNAGDSHAEWTFRDHAGNWPASGRLDWPVIRTQANTMPLRVAYVVALVSNRAVHLMGVSDVIEPNPEWRSFKRKLTGNSWDYVFRRLYYTWSPDITSVAFRPWIELANYEATAGWIVPGDLWLASDDTLYLTWSATALDERLRDRYFPHQRQSKAIELATVRNGKIASKRQLIRFEDGVAGWYPNTPRFHATSDGRLSLFLYMHDYRGLREKLTGNFLIELSGDRIKKINPLPMEAPLGWYVVASDRLGNTPSDFLDVLGNEPGQELVVRHAEVQIR
ncbi:MAG: hypothetical protein RBT75_11385 [Anaerolineae bacterium]|nr:hypothetical protein [Anaerolineae bacterium]